MYGLDIYKTGIPNTQVKCVLDSGMSRLVACWGHVPSADKYCLVALLCFPLDLQASCHTLFWGPWYAEHPYIHHTNPKYLGEKNLHLYYTQTVLFTTPNDTLQ